MVSARALTDENEPPRINHSVEDQKAMASARNDMNVPIELEDSYEESLQAVSSIHVPVR